MLISAFLISHTVPVFSETPVDDNFTGLSLEDLMSIQVTSVGKKPQKLSDSAAAIYVITGEDLKCSGATTIPDALRMVPGIQVARIDANKWAVSSRGFNSRFTEKLLVLIDGRNLYSPSFSGVYWEAQDMLPEDVERIEVIRGPGAALWGANAVNGVINIITRHSADTVGGLVSAGGGSAERAFGSVRYGASLGKGSYGRIYAKYRKTDAFSYDAGGSADDGWDSFHAGFRMDSRPTGPDNLTLLGDAYTGNISQTLFNVPSPDLPVTHVIEDDVDFSGGSLLARWQHILTSDSEFTFQAYCERTERKDKYAHEKRDSFDLDFQHRFAPADRHDWVWGIRYRYTHDDFTDLYVAEIDPADRGDSLFSLFIQDEISIVEEELWLILGSKFEHNDYSGYEIQPSGRILWSPHSDHRFWAAVSRAVRTPSRAEHDASVNAAVIPASLPYLPLPITVTIDGNPSFDSEKVVAWEAGYRFVPSSTLSLDLAFFYNNYDKLRLYVPSDPELKEDRIELATVTMNDAEGEAYGFEMFASWHPAEWFKADLGYSYINTDVTEGTIGGDAPKHQVTLRAGFHPADDIDMDVRFRYVDDTKTNYVTSSGFGSYEIDDYFTLDLKLSWHISEHLELIAAGENLLDDGHLEFVQEVFIAPTEVPRSFYGQVRYLF